jgi:hypothetical protein
MVHNFYVEKAFVVWRREVICHILFSKEQINAINKDLSAEDDGSWE